MHPDASDPDHAWVLERCTNCELPEEKHAGGKCPFEPTAFSRGFGKPSDLTLTKLLVEGIVRQDRPRKYMDVLNQLHQWRSGQQPLRRAAFAIKRVASLLAKGEPEQVLLAVTVTDEDCVPLRIERWTTGSCLDAMKRLGFA